MERPLTQRNTLTDTDDASTSKEDTDLALGRKGLHERGDNDTDTTSPHADLASSEVGNRSTKEPAANDST